MAELMLEPLAFEPARVYQKALFEVGIPASAFITKDIQAVYLGLKQRGVDFYGGPQQYGIKASITFKILVGTLLIWFKPEVLKINLLLFLFRFCEFCI